MRLFFIECIFQGCVRCGTCRGVPLVYTAGITGTGHFGTFGTTPVLVSDTLVSSGRYGYRHRRYRYRLSYRYRTLRKVPYDINTGAGHSVSSVRHQYRYREYWYRNEHTLQGGGAKVYVKISSDIFFSPNFSGGEKHFLS